MEGLQTLLGGLLYTQWLFTGKLTWRRHLLPLCVVEQGSNTSYWVEEEWLGTSEAGEEGQCGKEHTRLLSAGLGVKRDRLGA